jgi:hypothetical protein
LVLLCIGIFLGLSQTALDPSDFSGIWYDAQNQDAYLFQEGLITGSKEPDSMVGAYWYCRDSVVLFVRDMEGLETERELYLNQDGEVSFLSENRDGSGKVFFLRYKK